MRKIGILTFHRAINYGAQLQAYALQQVISRLGADCELVDYICPAITKSYQPFLIRREKPLLSFAKSCVMFRRRAKKAKRFESFQQRIVKSAETYDPQTLNQANDRYDRFITGSDQVFSPWCVDFDPAYFLTFADDSKKFSYAASFATRQIPEDKKEEYIRRLSGFQRISVREEEGIRHVKDLCGKDAVVSLDPTMLLSQEHWRQIAVSREQKPYILVYSLLGENGPLKFARKLAKEKNMQVICLRDAPHKPCRNVKFVRAASVEEFLGYFMNAAHVVSNSFHATAFSVIFHRSMFIEFACRSGRNVRAESLLTALGIRRELSGGAAEETPIDWTDVERRLSVLKETSMAYLKDIVLEETI
jgi:hypothetical protein